MSRHQLEASQPGSELSDSLHPNGPHSTFGGLEENADQLRKRLGIPDLTTRTGLKKVHLDFDDCSHRLDECYASALANSDTTTAMLVCIIWTKIAADALLHEQLLCAGLITKLIPLLGMPRAGGLAENLFHFLIYKAGYKPAESAFELCRHNPAVLKTLRDHPGDQQIADFTIRTLAHGTLYTVSSQGPSDASIVDAIALKEVLSSLLGTLRDPGYLLEKTLELAMTILAKAPPVCPKESRLKDIPSLLAYYSALTRSRHFGARCNGALALLRLARIELDQAGNVDFEAQNRATAPSDRSAQRISCNHDQLLAGFPEDLQCLMETYGVDSCETVVEARRSSTVESALVQFREDNDARALGRCLAEHLQHSEFIVNPNDDSSDASGSGLKLTDVLESCIQSLSQSGSSEDLDAAAILELHSLLLKKQFQRALDRAEDELGRNPELGYARYAYCLALLDFFLRPRAINTALASNDLTPFLRRRLLFEAVKLLGEQGCWMLWEDGLATDEVTGPATAHFKEAIEKAELYLEMAPPDARQRSTVLNWYIVVRIVAESLDIHNDLSDYEPLLEQLRIAERFDEIRQDPPAKCDIQLAREWLFENYSDGTILEWERLTVRLGQMAVGSTSASSSSSKSRASAGFVRSSVEKYGQDEIESVLVVQKLNCVVEEVFALWKRVLLQSILPEVTLAQAQGILPKGTADIWADAS
ncbi:hypothetical protein GSI_10776 [Ganoderma sinense ZZ0214-1]|uniref:Uncharacterized protein n=1 Tax=Ganoderma sinense ZZ0214-1 TaxID=1077348 RepID=A0A2G8S1K5_9APHY|nr:hypothetical protein GSI_10776 [Ganoderma sinense ZZ0214-1]